MKRKIYNVVQNPLLILIYESQISTQDPRLTGASPLEGFALQSPIPVSIKVIKLKVLPAKSLSHMVTF